MGAISAEDIISIIQSEIENFDVDNTSEETGTVIYVGDGIVTVYGIDHAMYGEVVVFDNGVKGMVQDIRQNEIGVILFGRDTGIKEGTKVVRTKKKAGVPVELKVVAIFKAICPALPIPLMISFPPRSCTCFTISDTASSYPGVTGMLRTASASCSNKEVIFSFTILLIDCFTAFLPE